MKAIEFPEVNVRIAEGQPQYETLPVHIDTENPQASTTMCFQLDPEEIKQVIETGRVWLTMLTFGQPFHPIGFSCMRPEAFTEPEKSESVMLNLNVIANHFHQASVKKGFWDKPREIGTLLMLIVSELSEALEADRKGKHTEDMPTVLLHQSLQTFPIIFKENVKDTFEDEIADTFIRLFDLVGALGIDIDKHIELKMEYNKTREYKHGKSY